MCLMVGARTFLYYTLIGIDLATTVAIASEVTVGSVLVYGVSANDACFTVTLRFTGPDGE